MVCRRVGRIVGEDSINSVKILRIPEIYIHLNFDPNVEVIYKLFCNQCSHSQSVCVNDCRVVSFFE